MDSLRALCRGSGSRVVVTLFSQQCVKFGVEGLGFKVWVGGLKRWNEGRWAKGSLIYTLLYWGHISYTHLPLPHLLSPLV